MDKKVYFHPVISMNIFSKSFLLLRQSLARPKKFVPALLVRHGSHGAHAPFTVSKFHTQLGEAFLIFGWLWFLHRLRTDGDIFLGWRHPWEHAGGDHNHGHTEAVVTGSEAQDGWDQFSTKALRMNDDDDDEEEEDDE